MNSISKDFTHPAINEEINAVGGHYVAIKEARVPYQDREFLYITGYAIIDRSCCDATGCGYAQVPGYILDWKFKTSKGNSPVSRVEPIKDPKVREAIRNLIEKEEGIRSSMIDFEPTY